MKISELIEILKMHANKNLEIKSNKVKLDNESLFGDVVYGKYSIMDYLKDLSKKDPNNLVMMSNGECERPGVYAPNKDGKIDIDKARPMKDGEAFPDGDWIQIAYLPCHLVNQNIQKHGPSL